MKKSTAPNASFDEVPPATPPGGEPIVGDADAVPDTSYVAKPVRLTDEELLREAGAQAAASARRDERA